jgi:hypothetical protein
LKSPIISEWHWFRKISNNWEDFKTHVEMIKPSVRSIWSDDWLLKFFALSRSRKFPNWSKTLNKQRYMKFEMRSFAHCWVCFHTYWLILLFWENFEKKNLYSLFIIPTDISFIQKRETLKKMITSIQTTEGKTQTLTANDPSVWRVTHLIGGSLFRMWNIWHFTVTMFRWMITFWKDVGPNNLSFWWFLVSNEVFPTPSPCYPAMIRQLTWAWEHEFHLLIFGIADIAVCQPLETFSRQSGTTVNGHQRINGFGVRPAGFAGSMTRSHWVCNH